MAVNDKGEMKPCISGGLQTRELRHSGARSTVREWFWGALGADGGFEVAWLWHWYTKKGLDDGDPVEEVLSNGKIEIEGERWSWWVAKIYVFPWNMTFLETWIRRRLGSYHRKPFLVSRITKKCTFNWLSSELCPFLWGKMHIAYTTKGTKIRISGWVTK